MENKLRAVVCDDMQSDAARLAGLIEECGIPADVRIFESGEALLETFRPGMYDVIFMDIYLGGIKGTEAVSYIRETDPGVIIAFATTSLDHTLESYRLSAFKYLEKPINKDAVRETLEYALLKRRTGPVLALKTSGGREENIPLDSILYLESRGHVVEVHTFSGVMTTIKPVRLDEIEKLLPRPQFSRCHRSFLINLDYAVKVDRDLHVFVMKNGSMAGIRRGDIVKYERELDGWYLYKAGRDI